MPTAPFDGVDDVPPDVPIDVHVLPQAVGATSAVEGSTSVTRQSANTWFVVAHDVDAFLQTTTGKAKQMKGIKEHLKHLKTNRVFLMKWGQSVLVCWSALH